MIVLILVNLFRLVRYRFRCMILLSELFVVLVMVLRLLKV